MSIRKDKIKLFLEIKINSRLNFKINKNLFAILILAIVTVIYFGVCTKGTTNIDDELIFNSLPDQATTKDLISVFKQRYNGSDYRPIVILSYLTEQLIFGSIDLSFTHGINVFLYFLIGILIFSLIKLFPIDDAYKHNFALITALIFIVHPVHCSVVASIKSRDNLLSMLFGIAGFIFIIKWIEETSWKKFLFIILAAISLPLSILSKLDAIGILASILLYILIFYPQKRKEILFTIFILFATRVIWILLAEQATSSQPGSSVLFDENPLVANETLLYKISSTFISLLYYTKFMIIPKGYYYYFGYNQIPLLNVYHPLIILSALFHVGIVIYAIYNLNKKPVLSFSLLFYFLTLAYCLNFFISVAGIVADRYSFIASLGFAIFVGYLISVEQIQNKNFQHFFAKTGIQKKNIKWMLLIALLIFYFPFTFQRNKDWENKVTLIERDLPQLQNSFHALRIASSVYQDLARDAITINEKVKYYDKSNIACKKAIAVYNSNLVVWTRLASNEYNIGKKTEAYQTLRNALQQNDTISAIYSMMANFFYRDNITDSAEIYFKKAISYNPSDADNYVTLTDILCKRNLFNDAEKLNYNLIKINHTLFEPYQNLANISLYRKDTLQATVFFLRAFENGMSNTSLAKGIQEYLIKNGYENNAKKYDTYLHTPTISSDAIKYTP